MLVDNLLKLVGDVDKVYSRVLLGERDVLDELDCLMKKVLEYEDNVFKNDDSELIEIIVNSFCSKINLIYKLLDLKKDNILTLESLRKKFTFLEISKFELENKYVRELISVDDIEKFKNDLFDFRKRLYAIPISDSNLIEIAKMKSKIQHFETEILEDEEILKIAYRNSN